MNLLEKLFSNRIKLLEPIFFLFLFSLPFSINFSNILLFVVGVLAIIRKDYLFDLTKIFFDKLFLTYLLFFSSFLFALLYTSNYKVGLFHIEKSLSLLIVPLAIFPLKEKVSPTFVKNSLLIFAIACSSAVIWLLLNLYFQISSNPELSIINFFREESVKYIELHPTYLSMYIAFSILIYINMILNSKISYKQNLLIINVLLLASVLPFTGARTGIVAFLVSLLSLGFFKLKSSKNRFKLLIAGLLLLPLVTFFIVKVPVIEQRISEIKHTPLEPPLGIHFNSINLRVAQLTCSKEILEKNWFLGVGTGDVQDELNSCYKSHGWSPALYERNYNTHNQYLQTWIASGLPGVLLFLTALVICITIAIRNNNPLFISFIVLFAIACLTESMLEKNKGIVFFMTFSVLQALPYLKYGKKINAANLKDEVYNV